MLFISPLFFLKKKTCCDVLSQYNMFSVSETAFYWGKEGCVGGENITNSIIISMIQSNSDE